MRQRLSTLYLMLTSPPNLCYNATLCKVPDAACLGKDEVCAENNMRLFKNIVQMLVNQNSSNAYSEIPSKWLLGHIQCCNTVALLEYLLEYYQGTLQLLHVWWELLSQKR